MSDRRWRWRWLWLPDQGEGAEEFRCRATSNGCSAQGHVVATLEGAPIDAGYEVEANADWSTPAIRRLGLTIGEAAEIRVAHVLVPGLSQRAAPQHYTRLADRLWRFEGVETSPRTSPWMWTGSRPSIRGCSGAGPSG